ncbi:hypothetical protein HDU93_005921, partial [Gonapodya sp. JEL0774]
TLVGDLASATKNLPSLAAVDASTLGKAVSQLAATWTERLAKVKQAHDELVVLRRRSDSSGVDEKTRKHVGMVIKKLDDEADALGRKAETLVASIS